MEITEIFT